MNTDLIKEKLKEEKAKLVEELRGLGKVIDKETGDWEAVAENTTPEADENDLADKFEEFQERSSTLETLELQLKDVNLALEKIEEGSYGICIICKNPIEENRLMANPSAHTCVEHMNS